MRLPDYSTQFKKDYKRVISRGYDLQLLHEAMRLLLAGTPLPSTYRDHALSNNWKQYRDLHLSGDWLLIYKVSGDTVYFARTGTHSDIFGK